MIVINDICEKCNRVCNATKFCHDFKNWTSGSNNIDEFIRNTQLSDHEFIDKALEWMPYNKLHNIAEAEVNIANWIDGCIYSWDNENQNWKRKNQKMYVVLKDLNNSKNATLEYTNEVKLFINKVKVIYY